MLEDMKGSSPLSGRASNALMPAWHKGEDPPATGDRMSETTDPALDLDADRLREECGVFGIFGHPDAAAITALGLHALQHRGQEAAGIVTFHGKPFHSEPRLGLLPHTSSPR